MSRSDVRQAGRSLRRAPGFAVVTVVSLVLGIALNTALFSVIESVLLRPLPYTDPDRLIAVQDARMTGEAHFVTVAEAHLYAAETRVFSAVGAYRAGMGGRHELSVDTPDGVQTGFEVSGNMLDILGVRPVTGRILRAEDERRGENVVVISERLRDRLFGGGNATGATMRIEGAVYTVVGVVPRGFWFPWEDGSFWVPLRPDASTDRQRSLSLVGRLRAGSSPEAAATEASALLKRWDAEGSDRLQRWARVASLDTARRPSDRAFFLVLQGVVLCVLVIACSNVAGLILVRVLGARKDQAVRASLGASPFQLLRPMLVENCLLVGAATLLGAACCVAMLRVITALLPSSTPLRDLLDISLNTRVLGFALAAAGGCLLFCTIIPALHATRADLGLVLKEEGGSAGLRTGQGRVRGVMVATQIALAVVLLVSSGLLRDHVARASQWRPGFDVDRLLHMPLTAGRESGDEAQGAIAAERLVETVGGVPGIESAALETAFLPAGGKVSGVGETGESACRCVLVSADYHRTLGLTLLSGRLFSSTDAASSSVAIIDERVARTLWPKGDPLGRQLRLGRAGTSERAITVVGVARATDFRRPAQDAIRAEPPSIYVLSAFDQVKRASLFARTSIGSGAASGVRRAVQEIDPDQAASTLRPLEDVLMADVEALRWYGRIFTLLSALGLGLAVTGLYGMVSYTATRRHQEFAIRIALGARWTDIVRLVGRQSVGLVLVGGLTGAVGAYGAAKVLGAMIVGMAPLSAGTTAEILVSLAAVVVAANLVPVVRVLRVDPARAFRGS